MAHNKIDPEKTGKETRFKRGEKQAEVARAGGIASGVAKRRKKAVAEVVSELLSKPDKKGQTMLEKIVVATLRDCVDKPKTDNLLNLQKILGEQKYNEVAAAIEISVHSTDGQTILNKIFAND